MTKYSWIHRMFRAPSRPASSDGRPTITMQPAAEKAERRRRFTAPKNHALRRLLRPGRVSPVILAFWLGGAAMGTGGCLLGALMPYHHPVAVANSMLWWGIYFGAFGASVCALAVLLTERPQPIPATLRNRVMPTEVEREANAA